MAANDFSRGRKRAIDAINAGKYPHKRSFILAIYHPVSVGYNAAHLAYSRKWAVAQRHNAGRIDAIIVSASRKYTISKPLMRHGISPICSAYYIASGHAPLGILRNGRRSRVGTALRRVGDEHRVPFRGYKSACGDIIGEIKTAKAEQALSREAPHAGIIVAHQIMPVREPWLGRVLLFIGSHCRAARARRPRACISRARRASFPPARAGAIQSAIAEIFIAVQQHALRIIFDGWASSGPAMKVHDFGGGCDIIAVAVNLGRDSFQWHFISCRPRCCDER